MDGLTSDVVVAVSGGENSFGGLSACSAGGSRPGLLDG